MPLLVRARTFRTVAALLCATLGTLACGAGNDVASDVASSTPAPDASVGAAGPATPGAETASSAAGGATPKTHAFGLSMRVTDTYLARRGNTMVAVPLAGLAAAVASGATVEFTRLASGAAAFGDLCLASQSPNQATGPLLLGTCNGPTVLKFSALSDTFCLLLAAPTGANPACAIPDAIACSGPSGTSCQVSLRPSVVGDPNLTDGRPSQNIDGNQTWTASALGLGQTPNGTLLRPGASLGRCLAAAAGGLALSPCNPDDATQRWSWQAGEPAGAVEIALASEAGACLWAPAAGSVAPVLGACSDPRTLSWILDATELAGINWRTGAGYALVVGPGGTGVQYADLSTSPPADPKLLAWQVGP